MQTRRSALKRKRQLSFCILQSILQSNQPVIYKDENFLPKIQKQPALTEPRDERFSIVVTDIPGGMDRFSKKSRTQLTLSGSRIPFEMPLAQTYFDTRKRQYIHEEFIESDNETNDEERACASEDQDLEQHDLENMDNDGTTLAHSHEIIDLLTQSADSVCSFQWTTQDDEGDKKPKRRRKNASTSKKQVAIDLKSSRDAGIVYPSFKVLLTFSTQTGFRARQLLLEIPNIVKFNDQQKQCSERNFTQELKQCVQKFIYSLTADPHRWIEYKFGDQCSMCKTKYGFLQRLNKAKKNGESASKYWKKRHPMAVYCVCKKQTSTRCIKCVFIKYLLDRDVRHGDNACAICKSCNKPWTLNDVRLILPKPYDATTASQLSRTCIYFSTHKNFE